MSETGPSSELKLAQIIYQRAAYDYAQADRQWLKAKRALEVATERLMVARDAAAAPETGEPVYPDV